MKKYLKHLLCLGLLGLSGSAYAEGGCPNGMTPVNNGQNWTCVPGGNDAAVQQAAPQLPPQPTGYWVKTWGAIAGDDPKGILGTALGVDDSIQAGRQAIADCHAKGGKECKLHLTYHNQCAVFVAGNNGHIATGAASIAKATEISMRDCKKSDKDCRVHYSACTEPRFVKY